MVVFNGISHVVLWTISVLYGGILSEEFGTCPIKHTVICCPFYVAACLSMTRFVSDLWILCFHILIIGALLSSLSHDTAFSMDGLAHQLTVIMLCCAQRYLCAVEDLLFTRSVCRVVASCVCEHLSDEQVQTAR